jgi:glycosyltransferase involved in cell wall biosynthesis
MLMRVVLDAYWLVGGTQSLRHAVRGLAGAWSRDYPDDELVLVVRRRHFREIEDLPPNVRLVATRLWPQALSATVAVPWHAWRTRADGMFSHNFAPLFGKNRTVFIHDLVFATNPEWFTRKELFYYNWMTRLGRRADVIFSSTDSENERISRFTRASRVITTGLGVSDEVLAGADEPVFGLTVGSFMLAVGRLNARKNLDMILEGAKQSQLLSPEYPLVIVGERDGQWNGLPDWVARDERLGHVRFTGFIPFEQLRWLIKNCSFYVNLSLDEGFGLPPIEARLLGARVLVSDRPVFRETLGEEATFVEPTSIDDVCAAMTGLTGKCDKADNLPSSLLERHTWQRTVPIIRDTISSLSSNA